MTTPVPPRWTFRTRVAVGTTLLCLGVLTLAGMTIYYGVRRALHQHLDTMLLSLAQLESASALDGIEGEVHVHEESALTLPPGVQASYEKYAQIVDAQGLVLATTANLASAEQLSFDTALVQALHEGQAIYAHTTRHGVLYRMIYYPMRDRHGQPLTLLCAVSTVPVQRVLDTLLATLFIVLACSGGLAAWGASHLARRLTRPLEEMAAAARDIHLPSQAARIPLVSQAQELYALSAMLNQMLERLERAFATQQRLLESHRRFVGDASHELRSPLTNLRGTVEVTLRRPRTPDEYREALTVCLGDIERLGRLVEDLLMLSRAEAGQFTFQFAPCDVLDVARQAIAAHMAQAQSLGVQMCLKTCSPSGAVMISGDAFRLRQMADNLLENALRYAPAGSVIEVQVGQDEHTAQFSVEDSGPGIAKTEQARIFERFYRTDQSRTRATGGVGLGLAIVKAIVEAHGGTIAVHSAPGAGTRFAVCWPLHHGGEVA